MRSKMKLSRSSKGKVGFRVCLECEGILRARKGIDVEGYEVPTSHVEEDNHEISFNDISYDVITPVKEDTTKKKLFSLSSKKNIFVAAPQSANSPSESKKTDAMEQYRSVVLGLLCLAAPEEVANIDQMIEAFKGREKELLELLRNRRDERQKLKSIVVGVLKRCAPDEVSNADEMIRVFNGREDELLDLLNRMEESYAAKKNLEE